MAVEQRLSALERALQSSAERTERTLDRLASEMLVFKEETRRDSEHLHAEMLVFKVETRRDSEHLHEEMLAFKADTAAFRDETRRDSEHLHAEMLAFKADTAAFRDETRRDSEHLHTEMLAFKAEMQASREESRAFREEMKKSWGDLANKMGTLVEDIVAPNLRGVASRYFGESSLSSFSIRFFRRPADPASGGGREFDAIGYSDERFFVVEVKSKPDSLSAVRFVQMLPQLTAYFPEAIGKEVIPIFASLAVPEDVITYLSRNGVYCMVMGEDNMVLANFGAATANRRR